MSDIEYSEFGVGRMIKMAITFGSEAYERDRDVPVVSELHTSIIEDIFEHCNLDPTKDIRLEAIWNDAAHRAWQFAEISSEGAAFIRMSALKMKVKP